MSNASLMQWNNISAPNFGDANALLKAGQDNYTTALKTLTDAVKTAQSNQVNRNSAKISDYVQSAKNVDELRSPAFMQGYNAMLESMHHNYDAQEESKKLDLRTDVLTNRFMQEQEKSKNELGIRAGEAQLKSLNQKTNFERQDFNSKHAMDMIASAPPEQRARIIQAYAQDNIYAPALTLMALAKNDSSLATDEVSRKSAEAGIKLTNANIGLVGANTGLAKANTAGQEIQNTAGQLQNEVTGAEVTAFKNNNGWLQQSPHYTAQAQKMSTAVFAQTANTYKSHILAQAQAYDVPPELVLAVMGQESGGKATAKSNTGVEGLMQVTGKTFDSVMQTKNGNRKDPYLSITAGTKYLGMLLKRYGGDTDKAIVAYNSGEGSVDDAVNASSKSGKPWISYIRHEGQDYLPRVKDNLYFLNNNETGKTLNYPSGTANLKSTLGGGGAGGIGGTGKVLTPTQQQTAYINSPQGIIAKYAQDYSKLQAVDSANDKTRGGGSAKNLTEWYAQAVDEGIDSMPKNMKDVLYKNNGFGIKSPELSKRFNKNGIPDFFKLSDAQQAGVMERAYQNLINKNSKWSNPLTKAFDARVWNTDNQDLVEYQEAIRDEVHLLLNVGQMQKQKQLDALQVGALNTLVQQHGYSPEQAKALLQGNKK